MRAYTVQCRLPSEPPVVLVERFSWRALIFGPLWLLWNGLWLSAIALLALMVGLQVAVEGLQLGQAAETAAGIVLAIWFGCTARDWRRWRLAARGHVLVDTVIAASKAEAEWRYAHRAEEARQCRPTPQPVAEPADPQPVAERADPP